jgi:hypothetical protein
MSRNISRETVFSWDARAWGVVRARVRMMDAQTIEIIMDRMGTSKSAVGFDPGVYRLWSGE